MSRVIYVGAFLDIESQWRLFARHPPAHANVFGDHVTLSYRPQGEQLGGWRALLGTEVELEVKGEITDEKGQAVLVSGVESSNQFPHITISCAPGVKPVYSNELAYRLAVEVRDAETAARMLEQHGAKLVKREPLRLRAKIDTYPRTQGDTHG